MGAGNHGGFGETKGARKYGRLEMNLQLLGHKVFESGGYLSE